MATKTLDPQILLFQYHDIFKHNLYSMFENIKHNIYNLYTVI